jgi:hypothetical protein
VAVPFRVRRRKVADAEFFSMPYNVRETFVSAFRELAAADSPQVSGPNWYVDELKQNQRIAPEGQYSLHVSDLYRGVFFRRRQDLVFVAFGYRFPDFYTKLERLRQELLIDLREHP